MAHELNCSSEGNADGAHPSTQTNPRDNHSQDDDVGNSSLVNDADQTSYVKAADDESDSDDFSITDSCCNHSRQACSDSCWMALSQFAGDLSGGMISEEMFFRNTAYAIGRTHKGKSDEVRPFPQFVKLPPELQRMIWEEFCPELTTKGCIFDFQYISFKGKRAVNGHGQLLANQTRAARTLRAINKDTRELVEKRFPLVLEACHSGMGARRWNIRFPINPETDIVRLGLDFGNMPDITVAALFDFFRPVQSISISHTSGNVDNIRNLRRLPSLKTLYIERSPEDLDPHRLDWYHTASYARSHRFDLEIDEPNCPREIVYSWPDASKARTYIDEVEEDSRQIVHQTWMDPNVPKGHKHPVILPLDVWDDDWKVSQYDKFIEAGGTLDEWAERPEPKIETLPDDYWSDSDEDESNSDEDDSISDEDESDADGDGSDSDEDDSDSD